MRQYARRNMTSSIDDIMQQWPGEKMTEIFLANRGTITNNYVSFGEYCFISKRTWLSITGTNISLNRQFRFLYARLQTGRIMVWWCPSVRPSGSPSVRPSVRHSFPHFSPTCFDIFFWNFVYHFIFMHVRSSSNAINFRHFLQELCSFLTSNSYKYAVFRTFLLHPLTYWVQILYMTLF